MTTTIKSGAGVSRYLRLYRVLSQALAEARFGPAGQPMPSEPRLMREYGVSRSTVRRALARLEAEGRIERKRGAGTFARDPRIKPAACKDLSPVLDGAARPSATATCRTVFLERIPTPAFLLAEEPEFGSTALLIRRIRYIAREPVVLETAYLPEDACGGLTRGRLGADAAILSVLAALGRDSCSLEREFTAQEADPLTADSLAVAVGAPVFNVLTLARDSRHRILAYVSGAYRPDRYEAHAAIEVARREAAVR
jgi:GntR family transcriptional regulator